MSKDDVYVGNLIFCCCGRDCGKTYEVMTDVYEKDGKEMLDIRNNNTGEIKSLLVDYLEEYIEY